MQHASGDLSPFTFHIPSFLCVFAALREIFVLAWVSQQGRDKELKNQID
jgi:hypothetical protein